MPNEEISCYDKTVSYRISSKVKSSSYYTIHILLVLRNSVCWRLFPSFYNSFGSKMTLKSLINFGNFGKTSWDASVERYHNDEGGYHHGHHRGSSKGKGGSSAALSALTLLAFLFLLNVMQQSLQDNNSTMAPTTTALLLRDTEIPIVLDNGGEKHTKTKDDFADDVANTYGSQAQ